jgi:hypothetical protein
MVVLAGLTACGAPEQAAMQATSTIEVAKTVVPQPRAILAAPTAIQNASQAPATVASATSGDWPIYRADKAGYSVAYPGGWSVQEETDSGVIVTTFAPSSGAPGITVSLQVTDTELAEPLDLPSSRRCKPVGVGGINGLRCLDVVRLRVPAPPGGQGKSYIIASTGAGIDQALYQRFLDSFTLIH